MLKDRIKSNFWGKLLISYYHAVKSFLLPRLIPDEKAIRKYYKSKSGRELNLENPVLYAKKLNWYKLNDRNPLMQQCADKYAVREYVKNCGLGDTLNELYGVYANVNEIKLEQLPSRFVLKASHGSHMNIIYPDAGYSWRQVKLLLNSWLRQDIYWCGREWVYKDMPRKIIAEKYLEDETGELRDYKFFCFNGIPKFMEFDIGRFKGTHYRNFYDMNLQLLEVTDTSTQRNPELIPIDKNNFERMKEMAKVLAEPFQFVRTDFYSVNGSIIFGELTFFDGGGYSGFTKDEYELMFGNAWNLIRNDR